MSYSIKIRDNYTRDSNSGTIVEGNTSVVFDGLLDMDGNKYHTVIIGSQEWIVENLKVTKYKDGTPIGTFGDNALNGIYCWYNNDISNKTVYGALYNSYAFTNAKGLVLLKRNNVEETGWRIPTYADFDSLRTELGITAGGKLKEIGLSHWNSPNTGATNTTGYTAVGGGDQPWGDVAQVEYLKDYLIMWTSTEEIPSSTHYTFQCRADSSAMFDGAELNTDCCSIRLVRDI